MSHCFRIGSVGVLLVLLALAGGPRLAYAEGWVSGYVGSGQGVLHIDVPNTADNMRISVGVHDDHVVTLRVNGAVVGTYQGCVFGAPCGIKFFDYIVHTGRGAVWSIDLESDSPADTFPVHVYGANTVSNPCAGCPPQTPAPPHWADYSGPIPADWDSDRVMGAVGQVIGADMVKGAIALSVGLLLAYYFIKMLYRLYGILFGRAPDSLHKPDLMGGSGGDIHFGGLHRARRASSVDSTGEGVEFELGPAPEGGVRARVKQ